MIMWLCVSLAIIKYFVNPTSVLVIHWVALYDSRWVGLSKHIGKATHSISVHYLLHISATNGLHVYFPNISTLTDLK